MARRRQPARRDGASSGSEGHAAAPVEEWARTRQGARSGRGFHFQDAVGAWLASLVATAAIDARVLVPEGFEDMSLEGDRPRHIQVKSRIERRGRFSISEACGHVLDAWNSHVGRAEPDASLVVVLERGIEGEVELQEIDRPLAESLPNDSQLRQRLRDEAEARNMRVADLEQLLMSTTVVGVDWAEVESRTVAQLADLAPVPPVARRLVERDLRLLVAEAADANASADYEHRRSLDRTELSRNRASVR